MQEPNWREPDNSGEIIMSEEEWEEYEQDDPQFPGNNNNPEGSGSDNPEARKRTGGGYFASCSASRCDHYGLRHNYPSTAAPTAPNTTTVTTPSESDAPTTPL